MKKIIIALVALLLLLGAGFYFLGSECSKNVHINIFTNERATKICFEYFKDAIFSLGKNSLQQFQKTDFGNIISQIKKEVFSPEPLNIGGKENNSFLTKSKVVSETNVQREANGGLPPLLENAKLNAAAKAKADDMFLKQYFEHISPSGMGPGELVKNHGYDYVVTGENLILGNFKDEKEMVQAWMDSPGHRANILNKRFSEIGVAVVKGVYEGKTVWIGVQEFGLPLSSCAQPNEILKHQIDANKSQLDQLALQIEARRNEINQTSPRSEKYNQLVDEYNALVAQYNPLNNQTKGLILQYNTEVNNFNQCLAGT